MEISLWKGFGWENLLSEIKKRSKKMGGEILTMVTFESPIQRVFTNPDRMISNFNYI